MKKLLLLAVISMFSYGCQPEQAPEPQSIVEDSAVTSNPRDRYKDACAEIGQTRMFEGSKRVDILKSVGGLSSQQAAAANGLIEAQIKLTSVQISAMKELAEAFNSSTVRDMAPALLSPRCYDEALELNNNACMLGTLAAVEADDDADKSDKLATAELMMRGLRIASNECESEITNSIVPTL